MKTKIKSYSDEATDFHEMPKVGSDYTCLAVINVGSALKKDGNYYTQLLLIEWQYIEKEVIRHIVENQEFSYSEILKKFCKHEKFLPWKHFISLDSLYTLDYEKDLLTTPNISYTDYQKLCSADFFLF